MQVTNDPITPPPRPPRPSEPASRPVERVEPVDAEPRDNKPTDRALERALVEAAGLKPAEASSVRVALSVDESSNRVVAKVFNKSTGELVRQIPNEELLRTAAFLRDILGTAVNELA